ncbi:MAG: DUF192 domain-containing protein [Chloroflexota bacterium]|nr:DUF192 domain-containing protein [Chloroflexota bacterium]
MRFPTVAVSLLLFLLVVACAESGLAEPIALPQPLPTNTPQPAATDLPVATPLPAATDIPMATPLSAATDLPTAAPLPMATEIPTATLYPTVAPLPAATELPTAEPASPAPVLPVAEPTPEELLPLVTIGEASWPVELAVTPEERSRGLSGREVLPEGFGMLFVFEGDHHLSFWMREMNFPLDMAWIDSSCHVVDVTRDAPVPEPGQSLSDLPRFSPSQPARFVLEINAGEFDGMDASIGEAVRFEGALQGQYGC